MIFISPITFNRSRYAVKPGEKIAWYYLQKQKATPKGGTY